MRLLHIERLEFATFRDKDRRPRYVIASHRWHEESEVIFQDVQNGRNRDKDGYKKIEAFAKYIRDNVTSVEWLWIDTCCINKDSSAELSEAINLMFDWYRSAELCIAYLMDVESAEDKSSLEKSEWFKRGWTLQELLAPRKIVFVTQDWQSIGSKGDLPGAGTAIQRRLEQDLSRITGIPEHVLYDYESSSSLRVDQKLKWMDGRSTTREEDMSYALYGVFRVAPGANYGEGHDGARQRLLAAINYESNLAAQRAEHFRKIVDWLSPADPWTNYMTAHNLREPQTGTWLLESDQYRRWRSGAIRHLWMYGKAGCGKTVLCATAIEDVKEYCNHHPNVGYAVFYLSFSDDTKQRFTHLLCSLVAQLGWKGPALSALQEAYDKPNRSLLGFEELEKILLLCFDSYDDVFLLIDALDECPEGGDVRHSMLEGITRLSQKARRVKILATSRELPDIRTSMAALGSEAMPLTTRSVDADIRQYVANGLSGDHRLSRLDEQTKTLIKETISAKADGMFQWAYCQVRELKNLKSSKPKLVREALFSLPSTLDGTYERMLTSIDKKLRTDALTLLRWLAYAKSPLTLGELVDATVIDLTSEDHVEVDERPGIDDPLEILSGLVIAIEHDQDNYELFKKKRADLEGRSVEDDQMEFASRRKQIDGNTQVRLAHFSVKEYLESKRILESSAKDFHLDNAKGHEFLCQSCLIYLTHCCIRKEKLSEFKDLTPFPLLRYAAKSWFYHSALQEAETVTREVAFLCAESTLHNWLLVYEPDELYNSHQVGSALYYASFTGLERVVCELLKSGAAVDAQGGNYSNALQAASFSGYEKIVQTLLDAGADVNIQGGHCSNALQAASFSGYEKIAASFRGHEKIVQTLLDAGADVNIQGGDYGSALEAASFRGREKIVQTLLDAGADVNIQGRHYSNALEAASFRGYEKIVQTLLDAGAKIYAGRGWYHSSALQAMLDEGNEKEARMLLQSGATIVPEDRDDSFSGHGCDDGGRMASQFV